MHAFTVISDFLFARTFNAGAVAYRSGMPRTLPVEFGFYGSAWLLGWDDAALEEIPFTLQMLPY